MFRWYTNYFKYNLRDKLDISEIIDIFTCEDIVSFLQTLCRAVEISISTSYNTGVKIFYGRLTEVFIASPFCDKEHEGLIPFPDLLWTKPKARSGKVRKFVFLDWLLHLTPVQSPLWKFTRFNSSSNLEISAVGEKEKPIGGKIWK